MPNLRKGELAFYKLMNPIEMDAYVRKFPENTEYVKSFLEKYEYNWVKKTWKKGSTI